MALTVNATASSAVANGSAAHVRAINCTGCCWSACDGAAVAEAGGGWGVRLVRVCKDKGIEVQHGVLGLSASALPAGKGSGQGSSGGPKFTLKWTVETRRGLLGQKSSGWKDWVKVSNTTM